MTATRNPSLFQCLPAEKEHELETSPEFVSMKAKPADLKAQPPSEERDRRRREIYVEPQKIQTQNSAAYKKPSRVNVLQKLMMNPNPSVATVPASSAFVD
jgi:hypothetical protein